MEELRRIYVVMIDEGCFEEDPEKKLSYLYHAYSDVNKAYAAAKSLNDDYQRHGKDSVAYIAGEIILD